MTKVKYLSLGCVRVMKIFRGGSLRSVITISLFVTIVTLVKDAFYPA